MLKLNAVLPATQFQVEMTEYVPVRMLLLPEVTSLDEVFYWRSTNKYSLLEVKVESSSGRLLEVAVVLVPEDRIDRRSGGPLIALRSEVLGLPSFDCGTWNERMAGREIGAMWALRRHDEDIPFRIFGAPESVLMLFDGAVPSMAVRNTQVDFYFDEAGEWCGFRVPGALRI